MTDNKLKDTETIKALKCLFGCVECRECPYSPRYEFPLCQQQVAKDALNLINRLQAQNKELAETVHNLTLEKDALFDKAEELKAEVEKLNKEIQITKDAYIMLQTKIEIIKSEAIKEFAERLKNEIINDTAYACDSTQHSGYYDYQIKIGDIPEYIDNLIKEIIGE